MLERLARRRHGGAVEGEAADAGFTLIELMVVLLIMAILLAIAIPTFLGVRGGANDRAAQSDLTNALTTAKSYFANQQSYSGINVSDMQSSEPSLRWINSGIASSDMGKNYVSMYETNAATGGVGQNLSSGDNMAIVLAAISPGNGTPNCWITVDFGVNPTPTGGTGTSGVAAVANMGTGENAGTWYAVIANPGNGSNTACDASQIAVDSGVHLYRSFGSAGANTPST